MYYYSSKKAERQVKRKFLIIALFSIIPFVGIIGLGFWGWEEVTLIDYQISNYFYDLHSPLLNSIMIIITHMGDMITQTLITIVAVLSLFFLKKWRTALWYGLTVLIGAGALNAGVKQVYSRVRPSQIQPLVNIGGYSFPSGHSMGSVIVYGGLLFLIFRYSRSTILKMLGSFLVPIAIITIGISRIYLGVHFPTDIVGGYSLGLTWLCLSIYLFGMNFTKVEKLSRNRYSINKL